MRCRPGFPLLLYLHGGIAVIDLESMIRDPGRGFTTLRHEVVHLVLGESGASLPRWVHEGLAQSLARQIPDPGKRREIALFARRGGLVPIHEMDQYLPRSHDRATTLYAVAALFTEWTRQTWGEEFHARILKRCNPSTTWARAFCCWVFRMNMQNSLYRSVLSRVRHPCARLDVHDVRTSARIYANTPCFFFLRPFCCRYLLLLSRALVRSTFFFFFSSSLP